MNCSLTIASLILGVGKPTLKSWICGRKKLKNWVDKLRKEKRTNVCHIEGSKKAAFGPIIEQQLLDYYKEQRAEL